MRRSVARLSGLLRAATLALLVLTPLMAAPTMAQSNFSFGMFFGDEERDFFDDDLFGHDRAPQLPMCLTDYQTREAIAREGYTDIALNIFDSGHVGAQATRGGWIYMLDFNYCTGQIEDADRLRPAG